MVSYTRGFLQKQYLNCHVCTPVGRWDPLTYFLTLWEKKKKSHWTSEGGLCRNVFSLQGFSNTGLASFYRFAKAPEKARKDIRIVRN
jgi:hypothetical protein